MNPENNQFDNNADSFEELRRQLGLDSDSSDGVSLLDEVMNPDKPSAPVKKISESDSLSAIERIQKELEDDDDEESAPAVTSTRRIVDESVVAVTKEEKGKKKGKDKSKKQLEKEKKRAEEIEAREEKRHSQRNEKALSRERKREEKEAAKLRKKNEKSGVSSSEPTVVLGQTKQTRGFDITPEKANFNNAQASLIENEIESADDKDINSIIMYEYDPEGAEPDRKGLSKFLYNTFPNRKDPFKEKLRKTISVLSVLVIIASLGYFGSLFLQRRQNVTQSNTLRKLVTEPDEKEDEQSAWDKIKAQYPDVEFPLGMNIKYAHLYAINPDFIGWLSVPNTQIDVQIVKAENNEKYLKQDFYGQYSRYGCPFMDFRDNVRNLSMNTIIYGHHMKDGLMFAELSKYLEPKGFEESPVITLSTLYADYNFKVYAVFITNSKAEDDNGYIFNYIFNHLTSDEAFNSYIDAVNERRLYDTGVDIQPGDKLLTLSTCTYEFKDARLVVLARLVRPGESATSHGKVKINENPRYPAVWYETNKQENPFEDAERWFPS